MDLWHHHMGHIGEAATRSLLQSVKGVTFPPGDKLSKCEPCIIGKHARSSHPSSTTHKTTELLELVFCDLCGPFPVLTPHGKLYLAAFLEDSANILKVHCLACKDQSAEAFHITKASWERKTGRKIICFWVDGVGATNLSVLWKRWGSNRTLSHDTNTGRMGRWNRYSAPSKVGCLQCSQQLNSLSSTGEKLP